MYIALDGTATLLVDGDEHALELGVLARVRTRQKRRILPEPNGFRMVAWVGHQARPTDHRHGRQLGGPLPQAP